MIDVKQHTFMMMYNSLTHSAYYIEVGSYALYPVSKVRLTPNHMLCSLTAGRCVYSFTTYTQASSLL